MLLARFVVSFAQYQKYHIHLVAQWIVWEMVLFESVVNEINLNQKLK